MPADRSGPPTQIIGADEPAPRSPESARRFAVVMAVAAAVLVGLAFVARSGSRSLTDEVLVREFTAAIDDGDVAGVRRLIENPTIVMWPSYWSILNTEHITPEGDRLDQYVEYHRAMEAKTVLSNCTVRVTPAEELAVALARAPSADLNHADVPFPQREEHDRWVRCDYRLSNSLAQLLDGPLGATHGRVSFGLYEGAVRTVFVIRQDRSEPVNSFRRWLSVTYPEDYQALLNAPDVLAIDIPIMGLVALDYNRYTARTLIEYAREYVSRVS